jgi:hypothetical protein
MQICCALAALTIVCSGLNVAAQGQIVSMKTVNGKQVTCVQSGLMSDLNDCGVPSWYEFAFIGSISSITPIDGGEKKLELVSEEVFHGRPASPLTVVTSQAACLPNLTVGERWLFFLRAEKGRPIVLDFYGNASRPVADAQEQIATLRRLKNIGNISILRGRVVKGSYLDRRPIPGAQIVASRVTDGLQFGATTGFNGRYEFQLLPPGDYKITIEPIGSFKPDDSKISLKPGACWDLTLSQSSMR